MKRRTLILIISIITLVNCTEKDDEIDCSLFDPVFPSLYLKIIDSNGVNLLENGTFKKESIIVNGDFSNAGFVFIPENENNSNLNNSLLLSIPNKLVSKYTIQLSNTETVDIDFKTEEVKIPCNISYYKPIEAKFKTENIDLKEFDSLQYYILIEL